MTPEQHSAALTKLLKFFKDLEANYPKKSLSKILQSNHINGVYVSAISSLGIVKDGKITTTPLNKELAEKIIEKSLVIAKANYDRKKSKTKKRIYNKAHSEPKIFSVRPVSEGEFVQIHNDINDIKRDMASMKSFLFDILSVLRNQS